MDEMIAKLESLASKVDTEFGGLSDEQFNWKPAPASWSVGQCLDHLVTTNKKEIVSISKASSGEYSKTLWERMPWLPGFFGRFLVKAVDPASIKKHKAPKVFQPSQSDLSKTVIGEYTKTSEEIRKLLKSFENKDISKMIITSPIAKFATYSLQHAFEIIVLHDRRHINQAKRVIETEGFPK